jgi:hypothetical protein
MDYLTVTAELVQQTRAEAAEAVAKMLQVERFQAVMVDQEL